MTSYNSALTELSHNQSGLAAALSVAVVAFWFTLVDTHAGSTDSFFHASFTLSTRVQHRRVAFPG